MANVQLTATHSQLLEKLRRRESLIGVVGLGYVGLPLCLAYAEQGFRVLGLDIDEGKTDSINNGKSYIQHIESNRIQNKRSEGLLEATTDFSRASEADALILCVPTPLNKYREPDLSFIRDTMAGLLPYLRSGQVLSLRARHIRVQRKKNYAL